MEIKKIYERFLHSGGVSTDTRKIKKGNIFFALKGPAFDGNKFSKQAIDAGALFAVVDDPSVVSSGSYILVKDVLQTLQQLAHYHRRQLGLTVIAVCGSNGKTTTKELMRSVLETGHRVFATEGNLNNHIGVPLSLLSIRKDHEIAILELGANHLNETKLLCEIAGPDMGIITNNGKDHLEGYGSIENVRKGNGELYDYLRQKNGTVFVCTEEEDLMRKSGGMNRFTYGISKDADVKGEIKNAFPFLQVDCKTANESFTLDSKLTGNYNLPNILCAVAVGLHFKTHRENIGRGIESYSPQNNRSQLLEKNDVTYILDCYNANPSSMEASIRSFAAMPFEKKILITGDMAELGEVTDEEHRHIVQLAQELKFTGTIFCGEYFYRHKKEDANMHFFKEVTNAKTYFEGLSLKGFAVLLKASRTMGLEKIIEGK